MKRREKCTVLDAAIVGHLKPCDCRWLPQTCRCCRRICTSTSCKREVNAQDQRGKEKEREVSYEMRMLDGRGDVQHICFHEPNRRRIFEYGINHRAWELSQTKPEA